MNATAEEDLYEFAESTAKDWYAMKLIDDRQFLALRELLHEMEKKVYYVWREDCEDKS